MKDMALKFLTTILRSLLLTATKEVWKGLWEQIFFAVDYAEKKWIETGQGEAKKEEVIQNITDYLEEHTSLGWIRKKIILVLISRILKAMIDVLNETAGHDWSEQISGVKSVIEEKISFLN